MSNDAANLPAVIEEGGEMVYLPVDPTVSDAHVFTSLDTSRPENRELVGRWMGRADYGVKSSINKTFKVVDVMCHGARRRNQKSGRLEPYVRIVLVCQDGKTIAGGGNGLWDSLGRLTYRFGRPPWKKGLDLTLVTQPTSSGHDTILLVPTKEAT